MIPFRKSIGFRLLGISIILLAIPLLVDSFVFLENRYARVSSQTKMSLSEIVDLRASPYQEMQSNIDKMLSMLIYFFGFDKELDDHGGSLNKELSDLSLLNHYHGLIVLKATEDKHLVSIGSNLEEYQNQDLTKLFSSAHPFSKEAKERGYAMGFIRDSHTGEIYQYTAKEIISPRKKVEGLFVILQTFTEENKLLLKADITPFPIQFALVLPTSIIFAATDSSLIFNYFHPLTFEEKKNFQEVDPDILLPKEPLKTVKTISSPYIVFLWKGEKQFGVIKKLEGTDQSLLAYAPVSAVFQKPFDEFMWYYGSFLVIFVIGVILAYFGTRRLTAPISHISHVMHKVKAGELEVRYKPLAFGYELNQIGLLFNEMVETLIEKEKMCEQERIIKERFAKELDLGREVQESILPHQLPEAKGVQIAHAFVPAIQVGGDFYDAYIKENGKLILAVADASGKGVQACCYALILKSSLRGFAKQSDDLAQICRLTNNLFCEDTGETGIFATVLIGQYDPQTRIFDFYSSGHNALIHYSCAQKKAKMLEFLDMAMGVVKKNEMKEVKKIALQPGDIVVLYSDGITETHNVQSEMYGDARLLQFTERESQRNAVDFAAHLIDEVKSFKGEADQHDDITLMVLKVE